jgi:hypothetical protein
MLIFFMAPCAENCQETGKNGYPVVRGTPEIASPEGL